MRTRALWKENSLYSKLGCSLVPLQLLGRGCLCQSPSTCPEAPLPSWVRGPVSLPRCFSPGATPAPGPDLPLPQVYFFCSASACFPTGLETCFPTCGSRTTSESGVGGGEVSCIFICVWSWLLGPQGPGHHPKTRLLPWAGQRRSPSPHRDTAEPQDLVSSPGPVSFVDSYRKETTLGPAGTRVCGWAPLAWATQGVLTKPKLRR